MLIVVSFVPSVCWSSEELGPNALVSCSAPKGKHRNTETQGAKHDMNVLSRNMATTTIIGVVA